MGLVVRARTVAARSRRCRAIGFAGVATGALVLYAAGCGDGDDDSRSAQAGGTTATTAAPSADEPRCDDVALNGRHVVVCMAGEARDQGLVVALHGRGSSADEMRAVTRLDERAAEAGLAVVYPDALDGGWGDDTFSSPNRPAGDEDVVFLAGLVRELQADPRVGDGPIGMVGFSNGASMALRYASERPDDVRAVVSVAGQLPRDPLIRPSGRVPLLAVYGTADPVRPYETGISATPGRRPGDPTPTLPTPDTVAAFVAVGAAPTDHEVLEETDSDPADGTRVRTERWTDGDGTVAILRTIVDGGHTWPSSSGQFTGGVTFGAISREIDASAEAIAFLLDPDDADLFPGP